MCQVASRKSNLFMKARSAVATKFFSTLVSMVLILGSSAARTAMSQDAQKDEPAKASERAEVKMVLDYDHPPKPGDKVVLDYLTQDHALLCTNIFTFGEMVKFNEAGDQVGYKELQKSKRGVVIEGKTSVLILRYERNQFIGGDTPYVEVRVLDGPHKDRTGILQAVHVWKKVPKTEWDARKAAEAAETDAKIRKMKGLPTAEQEAADKSVFQEIKAAVSASKKAAEKLPKSKKQAAFLKSSNKALSEIAKKHGKSIDQINAIMKMGVENNW